MLTFISPVFSRRQAAAAGLLAVSVLGVAAASASAQPMAPAYAVSLISTTATGASVGSGGSGQFAVGASQDGRLVAFTSDSPDLPAGSVRDSYGSVKQSLYVKNTVTGTLTTVSSAGYPLLGRTSAGRGAAISADGSTVAFLGQPADYGLTTATATPPPRPIWVEGNDVIMMKLATGKYTRVSHTGVGYDDVVALSISADGNALTYETASYTADTTDKGTDGWKASAGVSARSMRSGAEVNVVTDSDPEFGSPTFAPHLNANPVLSGDGSHVAFVVGTHGASLLGATGIKVIDVATGAISNIPLPSGVSLSSALFVLNNDGSSLVIRNAQQGAYALWIVNTATGASVPVTSTATLSNGTKAPLSNGWALSADGQRLVFTTGPVDEIASVTQCRFEAHDLQTNAHWVVGGEYPCGATALVGPGDHQIIFDTYASLAASDTNGHQDVYRVDVGTPAAS